YPGRSFRRLDPLKSESDPAQFSPIPEGSLPPDSGRNCTGNIRSVPDRFHFENETMSTPSNPTINSKDEQIKSALHQLHTDCQHDKINFEQFLAAIQALHVPSLQ
ncbi:unnamed protein product, partial [Adineta ricciae]